MKLAIASRASDLAMWQAHHVADRIRSASPGTEVEVFAVSTRGDREVEPELRNMGGQGLFTAEVDRALLDGDAHLAVHSLKDLPIQMPKGIELAAIPERGLIEDAWVSVDHVSIRELPEGARVGTSSPRRAAFLRSTRADLEIVNLRGNVPTRVSRVAPGDLHATILARAGLVRLGLTEHISQVIGPPDFLPAPGQGALAITIREGDESTRRVIGTLDDAKTRLAVDTERAVLAGLGGGCSLPLGVHACPLEATGNGSNPWQVSACLYLEEGLRTLTDTRTGDDPSRLAEEIALSLRKQGAIA